MSVGLSGNLKDFGIADVFQLIGQQRKTGLLALRTRGAEASLVFDKGGVVTAVPASGGDVEALVEKLVRCGLIRREQAQELSAAARASADPPATLVVERRWLAVEEVERIEDLLTRDTIFEVLRWSAGSFDFRARDLTHHRDPASLLGAEQILMDGLRMLDEWQSFSGAVPSDTTVFERSGHFEAYRQRASQRSPAALTQAERLFSLIDGRVTARRAIDLAQLGTFDGTQILAELVEAGLLKQSRAARTSRIRRPGRSGERLAVVRRAVSTVTPILLLALMVVLVRPGPVANAPEGAFAIQRDTLSKVRQAYETRRLRRAVDAFHMIEGRWPASLDDLVQAGVVPEDALATPAGRPYYSMRLNQGVAILAPER
jgi:hypothetical protein